MRRFSNACRPKPGLSLWSADCGPPDTPQQGDLHHQAQEQQWLRNRGKKLEMPPHIDIGWRHDDGQGEKPDAGEPSQSGVKQAERAGQFKKAADINSFQPQRQLRRHDFKEKAGVREMADAANQEPGEDKNEAQPAAAAFQESRLQCD
jgi:hypothetical protein